MIGSKKILDSNIDVRLIPSSIIEIPLFLVMGILSGTFSYLYVGSEIISIMSSVKGRFRLCSP